MEVITAAFADESATSADTINNALVSLMLFLCYKITEETRLLGFKIQNYQLV